MNFTTIGDAVHAFERAAFWSMCLAASTATPSSLISTRASCTAWGEISPVSTLGVSRLAGPRTSQAVCPASPSWPTKVREAGSFHGQWPMEESWRPFLKNYSRISTVRATLEGQMPEGGAHTAAANCRVQIPIMCRQLKEFRCLQERKGV